MAEDPFAAYVLTVSERAAVCSRTLADLARTDWQETPTVCRDEATGSPTAHGMASAYARMLSTARARSASVSVMFEDDLRFNRNLRRNLLSWAPVLAAAHGDHLAASLLAFGFHPETLEQNRAAAEVRAFFGSQAVVLGRQTLEYVVDHWHEEEGFPDKRISGLASQVTRLVVHRPSLVQHVGFESTLGHSYVRAYDFSRDWRSATSTCESADQRAETVANGLGA